MAYFPMYVDIENQRCLVAGGGEIALRKVRVLKDFGASVTVVAPQILPEIRDMQVHSIEREFSEEDLENCMVVVAATDDKEENHRIAELAKKKHICVNAVDAKEDCTFLFPAYVKKQNLVGAFSSGGNSPVITQYLKQNMQEVLTDELGIINKYMGSIRDTVKQRTATEKLRKKIYKAVLETLLEEGKQTLSEERLAAIIEKETKESDG